MAWWIPALAAAAQLGSSAMQSSSQGGANRTNVKLQREQQEWEAMMSNSAVQRRAADIEKAGGNRALAFTGGQEASTPSIAPARVEPKYKGGLDFISAGLNAIQAQNIQANTRETNARAAGQEMRNNLDNAFLPQIAALNLDIKEQQKQVTAKEYDLLEQQIKNAVEQESQIKAVTKNTGAQTQKLNLELEQNLKLLMQQVRMGEIDLAAAENIAKLFGQEAGKMTGVTQTILQIIQEFFSNRRRK